MFRKISPGEIDANVFNLISNTWMLITAGGMSDFNTMTASWGGFGHLWKKDVVFIFIRPTRHTYKYVEKYETFSLSFFNEDYRSVLNYCGTHSGKDVNKVNETGLIPFLAENSTIGFEQSQLLIECRKLYFTDLDPGHFLSPGIQKNYPLKDYHRLFIGEILNCFTKSE